MPKGPIIQHIYSNKKNGNDTVEIEFMRQASMMIDNIENSFKMYSEIKIQNCLYTRYSGSEEYIKYAYDKMTLYAFENEMDLKGDSYTVFIDEKGTEIVVDIFMEIV